MVCPENERRRDDRHGGAKLGSNDDEGETGSDVRYREGSGLGFLEFDAGFASFFSGRFSFLVQRRQ